MTNDTRARAGVQFCGNVLGGQHDGLNGPICRKPASHDGACGTGHKMSEMTERARVAAQVVAEELLNENRLSVVHNRHWLAMGLLGFATDAVAQAVKEHTQAVQLDLADRDKARRRSDEQAEEIARLREEVDAEHSMRVGEVEGYGEEIARLQADLGRYMMASNKQAEELARAAEYIAEQDARVQAAVAAERVRLLNAGRRQHRLHCSGPSPCDGCNLLEALRATGEPAPKGEER